MSKTKVNEQAVVYLHSLSDEAFATLRESPVAGTLLMELVERYLLDGPFPPGELLERDMSDEHFEAMLKAYTQEV